MWLIGRATFGFTGILGYILNAGPLQYIGKISYAIYLFHDFVPGMLLGLKYPENPNLRFVMYAAVTLGLASLSWHFFESKILKLKDRFE
jgi:peptidoglycan/LPS O-acetylase OafA/YrhL